MQCPKCRADLVNGILSDMLLTKHCSECEGDWVSADKYRRWQAEHSSLPTNPASLVKNYDLPHTPSPWDEKTATCPECSRIMSRGKVSLKQPFYIEHCMTCGGTWFDRGEWEILETIGLHTNIEQFFSATWQSQVRASQAITRERQALIDKVGTDLAQKIFDLADVLEKHPNGDFGAAYLMRRFDRNK
jgi:Zn-finger nucleic acid-binding protein